MIKEHPTLIGLLIDSNGLVYIPTSGNNKGHWTAGSTSSNKYKLIGYKKKYYSIHRLVAETFIPNPENKPFIDHINRDRSDNRVENLRWVTAQENQNNTIRNRQEGKHLKDFTTEKEYNADRARDRYKNEPGYKEYHREYLKKWREKKRQSM